MPRRLALIVVFAVVAIGVIGGAVAVAAPAGANLLSNPGAEAGAFSAQGWDAVTIPGWEIARGLPTVVRYGTPGVRRYPGRGARSCGASIRWRRWRYG